VENEQQVYATLDGLGIKYEVFRHTAVFTVEESNELCKEIPGAGCKNLFLQGHKGRHHFLVIVRDEKKVDLKLLAQELGLGRLCFASPEKLQQHLGLTPGSVSPFGLINDQEGVVEVLADKCLLKEKLLTFHPNINTATVVISSDNFVAYLKSLKNKSDFLDIPGRNEANPNI
jgi:Ala-tRNA(Pro) deacylase